MLTRGDVCWLASYSFGCGMRAWPGLSRLALLPWASLSPRIQQLAYWYLREALLLVSQQRQHCSVGSQRTATARGCSLSSPRDEGRRRRAFWEAGEKQCGGGSVPDPTVLLGGEGAFLLFAAPSDGKAATIFSDSSGDGGSEGGGASVFSRVAPSYCSACRGMLLLSASCAGWRCGAGDQRAGAWRRVDRRKGVAAGVIQLAGRTGDSSQEHGHRDGGARALHGVM